MRLRLWRETDRLEGIKVANNMRNVHIKMDKSNRAKQFMPFDALTGFREALREKERIKVERKELSEEKKEEIGYRLQQLKKMEVVTVEYYDRDEYVQMTGVVTKIDVNNKTLKIVETTVAFDNIYDLQLKEI